MNIFKKAYLKFKDFTKISGIYGVSAFSPFTSDKPSNSVVMSYSDQNIDPKDIQYWYLTDPLVYGSVNWIVDFVSSSGVDWKGKDSKDAEEWASRISLPHFISTATRNALLYGNLYIEPRDNVPFVADSATISPVFDEYGNLDHYEQNINGVVSKIPSESLWHIPYSGVGAGLFGVTPIAPLKTYLEHKSKVESHIASYFKRNGNPRLHYIVKSLNKDVIANKAKLISELNPHEDIVSGEDLEIKPVAQPISDMMYEKWLDYLNTIIRMGLRVPEIIAGFSKDSNKANSRIQYQAFKYRIKSMQYFMAHIINNLIIPHYLKGKDAYIVFKDFDMEDSNLSAINRQKIAMALSYLVKNGILTPEEAREYALEDLENIKKDVIE